MSVYAIFRVGVGPPEKSLCFGIAAREISRETLQCCKGFTMSSWEPADLE